MLNTHEDSIALCYFGKWNKVTYWKKTTVHINPRVEVELGSVDSTDVEIVEQFSNEMVLIIQKAHELIHKMKQESQCQTG